MRIASPLAALALLLAAALPANADTHISGCTDTATVSWSVDHTQVTVSGATVDVPGCADGELVGVQLITDDGDIPEDEPLVAEVADERATFDLTPYSPRVEPVTGVRVFLLAGSGTDPFFEVTVDQRFFNLGGNEQVGLRVITVLNVPIDGTYSVPGPPTGYAEVPCDDLGISTGDAVGEGSGTFDVTESGVHLACYQRQQGAPGGMPGTDPPEVLDEVLEVGDDPQTGREGSGDDASVRASVLARTGASVAVLLGIGGLLVAAGLRLRKHTGRSFQV